MTPARILAVLATMLLQCAPSDAQEKSRPGASVGSTLKLTLDFDALTDEWLDRQKIQSPTERELWKFLSGAFNREIVDAARGRKHYMVSVNFLHDASLPERQLAVRPDDPNADPLVLIAYRSVRTTVSRPEALVTVYSAESPPEPQILLTAHLQYDVEKARWDRVKDAQGPAVEINGISLPALGEPEILFVADGDFKSGYWTSLAFTEDSQSLVGTLQRNPGSRVRFLLGQRVGEVWSFNLERSDKAVNGKLLMGARNTRYEILKTPLGASRDPVLLARSDRSLKNIEVIALSVSGNEAKEKLVGRFSLPRNEKMTNNTQLICTVTREATMLILGTGGSEKKPKEEWRNMNWWGDVKAWDLRSGESRFADEWNGDQVLAVSCSADGKLVVAAGGHSAPTFFQPGRYDGRVVCWERGFEQKRFDLSLPDHQVYCLAFSPDSTTLVTGGIDGRVKWIDVKQGTVTKSMDVASQSGSKNVGQVESLAFSPNGNLLAVGAGSWNIGNTRWGATFLIDLRQGTVHKVPSSHEDHVITCVAFSPDGKYLATGGMEGILKLWDLTGKE